jgi:hypothetical protein
MTSNNPIKSSHTEVCSFLRPLYDQRVTDTKHSLVVLKTYVFRGSTTVNPSPSTLSANCSRRAMLRFLYVVLSRRSFDSSTDQGETASVERPFAAGRLQNTVGLGKERENREATNVSFGLMLGEERQRPHVSLGDTFFARDTYPNSVRCHPSVPFHLMEKVFRQMSARIHEYMAHLPSPPLQYHGRHLKSVQQPTVLRPSSTDPISRGQPVSCLSPTAFLRISL